VSDERASLLRKFTGVPGLIVMTLAIAWVAFHVVTAGLGTLPNYQQRAVHLGGALFFVFLLYQGHTRAPRLQLAIDIVLALACAVILGYVFVNYDEIVVSNWFIRESVEKAFGIALLLLILEAVRRTLGWMFVTLILVFFAYAHWGNHIPGALGHRGISFERLIYTFYLGDAGVLGTLMGVSATVVALFLIFGSLLNTSGAGDTFIRIAMRLGGRLRGGAGLAAVIGSAFMGMINGSTVANVTSTGVLTIPLMKRLGFKRNIAGAIEAVASTGGQIMPPVMGPGAFLMAELLGIPYLDVAIAAFVPSMLFFAALLLGVYLLALRYDLQPLPDDMIPTWRQACPPLAAVSLVLPIGILLYFILQRYTIQLAVFWAVVSIALMMVTSTLLQRRQPVAPSSMLGIANEAAGDASPPAHAPLPSEHAPQKLARLGHETASSLYGAALGIAYIAMIIVAAQVIVSVINLTGVGVTLAQVILGLGGQYVLVSLLLTMMLAIVLGMGMPTPAAYAVGAAVLAPPLISLGFEVLPAHLFLYFFASVSAITPPVAAGVFAAIAISGGTFMGTARYSLTLACTLFIIPYMFILNPVLTLSGEWTAILTAIVSASLGVGFLSVAVIGYLRGPMGAASRIIMGVGAFTMVMPGGLSDLIGIGMTTLAIGLHLWRGPVIGNGVEAR
jgi:TRAP transporter 4TM/12TM fusion protein